MLRFGNSAWTYRELDAWASRIAAGLKGLGLAKGDRLAVMLPNHADFVALLFGSARLGTIQVPVNTAYKGNLLRHIVGQSKAYAAVVVVEFLDRLEPLVAELSDLRTLVIWPPIPPVVPRLPFQLIGFDEICAVGCSKEDDTVDPHDPVGIIYTSGTTGPSKGVVFSHNFMWWHGERARVLRGATEADCLYTCLPLFHSNAQMLSVVCAVLAGGAVALDDRFHASSFWDRMRQPRHLDGEPDRGIWAGDPAPDDDLPGAEGTGHSCPHPALAADGRGGRCPA